MLENVEIHRDIKFLTTKSKRDYLVPEQQYHARKFFSNNLLATEITKLKYS